jgi:hypothetical protein
MGTNKFNQIGWTREDKDMLKLWIKENPNVQVSQDGGPPTLNELFPHRSPGALYAQWRSMRLELGMSSTCKANVIKIKHIDIATGEEIKNTNADKTFQLTDKGNKKQSEKVEYKCYCDFNQILNSTIDVILRDAILHASDNSSLSEENKKLKEKVEELTEENNRNKEMLRKLCKLRQAAEEYKEYLLRNG